MPLVSSQLLDRVVSSKGYSAGESDWKKVVLERAKLLERDDRLLVEMALRGQLTRRQIASLLDCNAGNVTRRFYRIMARLRDPLLGALLDPRCPLPPEYRQLGIERIVQRQPLDRLAQRHQIRQSEVRRMLAYLGGWHRGITSPR